MTPTWMEEWAIMVEGHLSILEEDAHVSNAILYSLPILTFHGSRQVVCQSVCLCVSHCSVWRLRHQFVCVATLVKIPIWDLWRILPRFPHDSHK